MSDGTKWQLKSMKSDHFASTRLAVDKDKLCPVDLTSRNPSPRFAIVIEKNGKLLGWTASRAAQDEL